MLLIKHKKEAVQAIRFAHKPFTASFFTLFNHAKYLSLKRVRIAEICEITGLTKKEVESI